MTDFDMARLCAEAMGLPFRVRRIDVPCIIGGSFEQNTAQLDIRIHEVPEFNPLHDDAQAMALVKRFGIWLRQFDGWLAQIRDRECVTSRDLNRAIVECVAEMQKARATGLDHSAGQSDNAART